jgi:putative Mg2+ transporter-C (MgtC) family protein
MNLPNLHLELLAQLALAVLLGGAIGLEREIRGKPAGLRTNVLICVGATLFTSLSHQLANGGDAGRVAGNIVTGVGFLGAGCILHARGAVIGLTSAATIWVVAAIGMALGTGAYVDALGSTALVMIVLTGLLRVEGFVSRRAGLCQLVIHGDPTLLSEALVESIVHKTGLSVQLVESRHANNELVVEVEIYGPKRLHEQAMLNLLQNPGVHSVSTGE